MALDMFLQLGDLKGESIDATHKDKIDILAWSWGMSNSATSHLGTGSGGGKVAVQDISVTKYIDASSTYLYLNCAKGKHYEEAQIIVRKAGDTPLEYLTISLKKVIISSVSTGGSGGEDRLTENLTLNFAEFKVEYKAQLDTGGSGVTPTMAWNIPENVEKS